MTDPRGALAPLILNRPWYLEPGRLEAMAEAALRPSAELVEAAAGRAPETSIPRTDAGGVRILTVAGTIVPRPNFMTLFFGGTSLAELRFEIDAALRDPRVRAVLLDVDSPGGSVDGLTEFAVWLRAAQRASPKPIVAHANYLMASAAYYIAAQATEIVAAPSAMVGSVGTVAVHWDYSRAYDQAGITPTLIASDPRKVEHSPYEPLADDARAELQRVIDHFAGMFVADVAKGRGLSRSEILAYFGGGRLLLPAQALNVGMVDRVEPIEETIARLAAVPAAPRPAAAPAAERRLTGRQAAVAKVAADERRVAIHEAAHLIVGAALELPILDRGVMVLSDRGECYVGPPGGYAPAHDVAATLAGLRIDELAGRPNALDAAAADLDRAARVASGDPPALDAGIALADALIGRYRRPIEALADAILRSRGRLVGPQLHAAVEAAMASEPIVAERRARLTTIRIAERNAFDREWSAVRDRIPPAEHPAAIAAIWDRITAAQATNTQGAKS